MDEAKQTPSASGAAKVLALSFLVGGLFSVVGQVFMVLGKALLGEGSPLVSPFVLVCMGVLGVVLFVPGIYQKLMGQAGFGTIMPFCGFAAACALEFCQAKGATGSTGKAVWAAFKLLIYVVGTAALLFITVAAIFAFGVPALG